MAEDAKDKGTQEGPEENPGTQRGKDDENRLTLDEVRKMVQSEGDKIRTEYTKRIQEKDAEIEELKKKSMSAEEKAKHEAEQERKKHDAEKAELLRDRVNFEASKALEQAGLSVTWAELVRFPDLESIDQVVEKIQQFVSTGVEKGVQTKLTELGIDLADTSSDKSGGTAKATKNPWSKDHLNLTEQARILREDPKLAEKLKAQAQK